MASIANKTFHSAENIASNISSDSKFIFQNTSDFIGFLKVENYVAGTYTVKIQHSPNKVDWFDLVSFVAVSSNGVQSVSTTDPVYPHVRSDVAVVGGDADITVQLWFDPNK